MSAFSAIVTKPEATHVDLTGPVDHDLLVCELESFNRALEPLEPIEIMGWAARAFGADATLSCSFGGPSGMVLIDILATESLPFDLYSLDTGLLFPETHDLAREVEERYGIEPHRVFPRLSLAEQAGTYEDELWRTDPDLCCAMRKTEPNRRALAGKTAWISGVRRDQSSARAATPILSWSENFKVFKIAPLANWSEADVWEYIRRHDVPYNKLHDQGMRSLGCTVCTTLPQGADPRSGRWPGFNKVECGLHI